MTRPARRRLAAVAACCLLLVSSISAAEEPVSPYDFPYGYPFPDYPTAGASHPRRSADYMRNPPNPRGSLKRIGQYALRLIQTDRVEQAVEYTRDYLDRHAGIKDEELHFFRAMAEAQLGNLDEAAAAMQRAIQQADLPPQRFIAGPRRLFAPLHEHPAYRALHEELRHDLVHGPLLGSMTDRGVRVWVRTADETPVRVAVSRAADLSEAAVSDPVVSRAEADYTAVIPVEGLEPDTLYHYAVLLGDERHEVRGEHQRFRTFPAEGRPAKFRIAFGGGAGYEPPRERMWDTIRDSDPLSVLLMGDNMYIDDPESPDQQRYCYYQRQSRPEFRRLVGSRNVAAIWDDHDFGMDDSWGGPEVDIPYWKPMVWEIFKQNWANPAYGGGRERPGVWFDFQIADVHFILLDGRYYRTDPGRRGGDGSEVKTMLGPEQLAWFKQTLTESEATFKVLVSPVPWDFRTKPGQGGLDTWRGFAEERAEIFSWIKEHEIGGVVLLSADRHRSDAWRVEREDDYDLYEFSSSQLTNEHTHALMPEALLGYNAKQSFGLVTFDTTAEDPSVTYQIVNIDGETVRELDITRSMLE